MQRVRAIAVDRHGRLLFGVTRLGQYGLVGGKVDDGETEEATLRRELREESGVTEIANITHLFDAYDNKVYRVDIEVGLPLTPLGDPDGEFDHLELVYFNPDQPPPMDDYSESILFGWLLAQHESEATNVAFGGKMQVFCDDELIMEFADDVIWQTMPKLAQLRSKGKQLKFKQITDNNEIHDFSTSTFPAYFDNYKRIRVLGLDMGITIGSKDNIVGLETSFGGTTYLITSTGSKLPLRDEQLNLDMHLLDFADLEITAHSLGYEASALAAELLREYFPDCETEPEVVIIHSPPFVASTRHNNETGHTYITLNSKYLVSEDLRQILAHEVVHYYIYEMFGDTADKENVNHGDLYKDLAEEINKQEGHGFIGSSADATKWESALALCATKLITTEVFGGAYKIERPGNEMLTHAVLVTPDFNWDTGRSLCKKVKNIMDDRTQWTKEPPTCTACLSKWNRFGKEHPEYINWEPEQ